jgi:uncharacterized protein YidB (DUF937 family)
MPLRRAFAQITAKPASKRSPFEQPNFNTYCEVIMGMLDGILGGVVGGEMASVVNGFIEKHGGVQGIIGQLEQQGLGATARSWVGNGPNQSISPNEIHQVFGTDAIKALAAKAGISPQDLANKLSAFLPQAIDRLTPAGALPSVMGAAP